MASWMHFWHLKLVGHLTLIIQTNDPFRVIWKTTIGMHMVFKLIFY